MECWICKGCKVNLRNSGSAHHEGGAVCCSCYAEFNRMMNLMNKNNNSATTRYLANWGEDSVKRWTEEAEAVKKTQEGWISYFGGLAAAFKEESFSDIQVKPGNGPSIPAHKFMLANKSEVFKHMLSSDTCKAAPGDSIYLPEFNHEELETFLELLYCGNLSQEKFEMHFYCLALASHKYAIPHLEKYCEENILKLLDSSNALRVLEISEICLNETLRVAAVESILDHQTEIIGSPSFDKYAVENPHLVTHILRHSCTQWQCKKRKHA